MHDAVIVVPCYNEEKRLNATAFRAYLAADQRTRFLFVNDGSTDRTLHRLLELRAAASGSIDVIDLPRNAGKAEAVRQGMLAAMDRGPLYAGYWDADLSTPLSALPAFYAVLDERNDVDAVLGARVRMLGTSIERRARRHYVGRLFATAASAVLGLPVYDTQCGAKLFRVNRRTSASFFEPFRSRWIFDVELIGRLAWPVTGSHHGSVGIYELPLAEWRDVAGSKLRIRDFVRAFVDLVGIYRDRGRFRSAATGGPPRVVLPAPTRKPTTAQVTDRVAL